VVNVLDEVTSRRSVLRGLVAMMAAGAAGYVVARNSGLAKPKAATTGANGYGPTTSEGRYLVPLSEIPPNGGVILAADKIVLVRERNGLLKGFSAVCTHQGCTVATIENGIITCPCHGSQFSAVTGDVLHGPATRPLPPIGVAVRDSAVYTTS
jgi:Rieske Fe-S protein